MKKTLQTILLLIIVVSLVISFSLTGCKKEAAAEKTTKEVATTVEATTEKESEAASQEKVKSAEELVSSLPKELQDLYESTPDPILPSAYDDFKPVEGPWLIGYADSYQGNPWRVAVRDELIRLADDFKGEGKVIGFENMVSNNDVAQNISNIRALIDKKVDVILSIPESTTGLNDAIEEAYKAGIPFITMAGPVTSPYAINVTSNFGVWGYDMMNGIGERLNGKGNVLMVEGLAGHPIVLAEGEGFDRALEKYPDIEVIARVNGNWTLSVTKEAVLQVIATHPEPIDAVWTTGSEARVVAEAFKEAGRPIPLITGSLTGDIMGYWKENGDEGFKFYGFGVLPQYQAEVGFRVAIKMLEGQHPKLNLINVPLPEVKQEDLPDWYTDSMTIDATSVFPIPKNDPFPEDKMNEYFLNGSTLAEYDYSKVPKP